MKYVVEFDRDDLFDIAVALQFDSDRLEGIALSQRDEGTRKHFMQESQRRLILYKKIIDTYKVTK